MSRLYLAAFALAVSLSFPYVLEAQDNTAVALTLFGEGKKLVEAGKYGEACPKFLSSYKLVPKLGTLMNLADCYEQNGQTASAWARFREAMPLAEAAGQGERASYAKKHADALVSTLATLTLTATTPAVGLAITLDDALIPTDSLGAPIPVDPGDHTILLRAPKKKPRTISLIVPKSSAQKFHLPELEDEPEPVIAKSVCELGDVSCGRPFVQKRTFLQVRLGGATYYGTAQGYEGALRRVGAGIDVGLSFVYGLSEQFPAGIPGSWHGLLIEPLVGLHGGGVMGFSPSTDLAKGSTDFALRGGVLFGYQFFRLGARDTIGNQRGVGFLVGYRPGIQSTYVSGFWNDRVTQFAHGPVLAALIPTYSASRVKHYRSFIELAAVFVPKSTYFVLSSGVAFP